MRTIYLTTMIFCHILLSSFILYSSVTSASPVVEPTGRVGVVEHNKDAVAIIKKPQEPHFVSALKPVEAVAQFYKPDSQQNNEGSSLSSQDKDLLKQKSNNLPKQFVETPKSSGESPNGKKEQPSKYTDQQQIAPKPNKEDPANVEQSPAAPLELKAVPDKVAAAEPVQQKVYESPKSESSLTLQSRGHEGEAKEKQAGAPVKPVSQVKYHAVAPQLRAVDLKEAQQVVAAPEIVPVNGPAKPAPSSAPAVKGGLGPLHLLAATLCSYQPHKPVSDETLTYLYNQRAAQRKSLFQFMSLKFTNLDKLTAHLNAGLDVAKTVDSSESSLVRSHGWPVVGNCTAHYLKLMAEAAWCDCAEEPHCVRDVQQHAQPRLVRRWAAEQAGSSSVMSKLMYIGDVKEAPVVETSQVASVKPATVASTRQCRRNALRLAKALFNHLAENQTQVSESWPKLHAELAQDECARKRMIDIVTALSTFRGESTQVHRDNIEFAFAMDDLRGKVLENEVNTPLTFDKQVIEVEQFLQQSVRLMLANIDPKRAKLTSMRYRSLHAPVSADDQCIELHQRLLAKNYPDECNPNQYGPLPDVLRMAALSLDLWSIEQDLSKYSAGSSQVAPKQQDVNECIANLVAN